MASSKREIFNIDFCDKRVPIGIYEHYKKRIHKMLNYIKIKYLLLFVICFWEPLRIFVLKFDFANRTIGILSFLTVLVNIANFNFMRTLFKPPVIYWGIWVIYAFINTVTLGYSTDQPHYSFFITLSAPFMVVWVISSDKFRDREVLLNIVTIGLYIRMMLLLIFESTLGNRLGVNIDSNAIGVSALVLIIFLYFKFIYKEISIKLFLILLIIPFYVLLISASRNAFGGFAILLISFFYTHRSKNFIHNLGILLVGSAFVLGTFYFIIETTYLGERFMTTTEQSTNLIYYDEIQGTIFERFGDRGFFYVVGFRLFLEHPIRGVGLKNFSQYLIKGRVAQHSEYMIQLCELGIIGTLLFILFYGWMIKNLIFYWRNDTDSRAKTEVFLTVLLIILFMGLSLFQYNDPILFLLIGATIAYGLRTKEDIKKKRSNEFLDEKLPVN